MNDENARPERSDQTGAFASALALNGASRDEADAFLRKQSRLADLQIEDIERENRLRHWSLRFGNISAVMKVAFEIALAFIMLALAALIASAIWSAAHDDGLVIEAFNVPADMSAKGLSGQVIATQVQDRISFIQSHADTLRAASTFRNNWGDDIKVQIPDTGVSIGEAYRFLARSLGHETHITGEVWHERKGIALSARAGNEPAKIFHGSEGDLDSLIAKAAEYVYWQTQPYRFTVFLDQQRRTAEGLALTKELAISGPAEDRAWSYSRWGIELDNVGEFKEDLDKQNRAVALAPGFPHVFGNRAAADAELGHDEAELRDNRKSLVLLQNGGSRNYAAFAVPVFQANQEILIADELGDFSGAVARAAGVQALPDYNAAHVATPIETSSYLARLHDVAASQKADPYAPNEEAMEFRMMETDEYPWDVPPLPEAMRRVAMDNWRGVRDDLIALGGLPDASTRHAKAVLPVVTWPWLAYAYEKIGDSHAAEALIAKTPLDCYLCVRMRGNIEAVQKHWSGAASWFTEAVKQAPSIPFAYTDWGAMLLAKGDFDGAIAQFESAHEKEPHFADPLELWGEALMQKNRSDLALAKFAEADKYAPNWGRLHLKWGEALLYIGKRGEAQKQFDIASHFDLSPEDAVTLKRIRAAHA